MPICIYCLKEKPAEEFSNEHVLTRAFCGQGANWTLVEMVCAACNGALSKFETHWASSAIEALMRNFSGPQGRSSRQGGRSHPLEVDELYLVQGDDPLVYEAGFAFPGDFYFRPQFVETGTGVVIVAANQSDGAALQDAIKQSISSGTIVVTEPVPETKGRYRLTTITLNTSTHRHSVTAVVEGTAPQGIWLRRLEPGSTFDDRRGKVRPITRRLALDDRGRLYLRAADSDSAASFFDGLTVPPEQPAAKQYRADEQLVRTPISTQLPLVYRCVLKTGLNLLAHTRGASTARDETFDDLRRELFDPGADTKIMQRCGFLSLRPCWLTWLWRDDFPPPPNDGQHRMMLAAHRGRLRFRLRLYGHLGYQGDLGSLPAGVGQDFAARVIVDYGSSGIRSVTAW